MEKPCDESLIRGTAAALVGSVAVIVVGIVRSGAVFMSRFRGTREASARFGHAQAIVRCAEAVQFQWWVRIFRPQSDRYARYCRATALSGLRDGEEMPLICPTCQLAFKVSMPAACYFAWGCFRYFGSAHLRRGFLQCHPLERHLEEEPPAARLGKFDEAVAKGVANELTTLLHGPRSAMLSAVARIKLAAAF